MKHVFVETNWVFDACAPEPFRTPEACKLLDRAASDELTLHLPAICLREAADALRHKYKRIKSDFKPLREFRRWSAAMGSFTKDQASVFDRFLDAFDRTILVWDKQLDASLDTLREAKGVDVFALNQAMLERVLVLRQQVHDISLKPFDEAILAAVLVRAEELRREGLLDFTFCEKDADLQARRDNKDRSPHLLQLYSELGIVVAPGFQID